MYERAFRAAGFAFVDDVLCALDAAEGGEDFAELARVLRAMVPVHLAALTTAMLVAQRDTVDSLDAARALGRAHAALRAVAAAARASHERE